MRSKYVSQIVNRSRTNAVTKQWRILANALEPLRDRRTVANMLGLTTQGVAYIEAKALAKIARLLLRAGLFVVLTTLTHGAELYVSNQSTGAVRLVVSGLPGTTLVPPGLDFSGRFDPDGTNVVKVYESVATNWGPVQIGLATWSPSQIGSVRVWVQESGLVAFDEAASPLYWFFRGGAFGAAAGLGLWVVRWLKFLSSAFERIAE